MKKVKIRLRGLIAIAAIILVIAIIVAGVYIFSQNGNGIVSAEPVRISGYEMAAVNLGLGDADCTVIMTNTGTAMIDAGNDENSVQILSFLSANDINTIDYLILTNYDDEHIGGAASVIGALNVRRVLVPEVIPFETNDDDYIELMTAINNKEVTPYTVTDNLGFSLADAKFTVYSGNKDAYSSDKSENMSLVVSAVHGDNKFLFTSDIENARMSEIISSEKDFGHTYLKVPNHGEFERNTSEFLKFVSPKYAVITNDNSLDIRKTKSALKELDTDVYVADNKSVYIISNLNEIEIYQK